MKKLICLLLLIPLFTAFVVGGDDSNRPLYVNTFEPELNLQFIGINDTLDYTEKGKARKMEVLSNVAVYDIANNKTNYVFNDGVKRNIIGFEFESHYFDEYKTIEFNNDFNYNGYERALYQHSNNRNVKPRALSENLIIITADADNKNFTFWIVSKYGTNLRKEIEVNKEWDWEIDVKNRQIRFSKQTAHKVEIKNVGY